MSNPWGLPEMGPINTLGDFVSSLRQRVFRSLRIAARSVGVNHTTLARYESEQTKPPLNYIAWLMTLIIEQQSSNGTSPADLEGGRLFFVEQIRNLARRFGGGYSTNPPIKTWDQVRDLADSYIAYSARRGLDRLLRSKSLIRYGQDMRPYPTADDGLSTLPLDKRVDVSGGSGAAGPMVEPVSEFAQHNALMQQGTYVATERSDPFNTPPDPDVDEQSIRTAQTTGDDSVTGEQSREKRTRAWIPARSGPLVGAAITMAVVVVLVTLFWRVLQSNISSVWRTEPTAGLPTSIPPDEGSVANGSSILEELWLDSWHSEGFAMDYNVKGSVPIAVGQQVTVVVQGTFSAWSKGWWTSVPACNGTPEASPQFPTYSLSTEDPNGPAAIDAEYAFAAPAHSSYCSRSDNPPFVSSSPFEISADGTNWLDPTPLSSSYSVQHKYSYRLTGAGVPFEFRTSDPDPSDNYGRLHIIISSP